MEKFLNEDIVKQIREVFAENLQHPVEVLFFEGGDNCEYCEQTKQLLDEVIPLNDLLKLTVYNVQQDVDAVKQYQIDKTPGMVIAGRDEEKIVDYGIRIYGIPAGHEFTSFINDLILVSMRDSGLNADTRKFLAGLTEEVLLQVFVTPT